MTGASGMEFQMHGVSPLTPYQEILGVSMGDKNTSFLILDTTML